MGEINLEVNIMMSYQQGQSIAVLFCMCIFVLQGLKNAHLDSAQHFNPHVTLYVFNKQIYMN